MSVEASCRSLVEASTGDWFIKINVNMGEMEDDVFYSSTKVVVRERWRRAECSIKNTSSTTTTT